VHWYSLCNHGILNRYLSKERIMKLYLPTPKELYDLLGRAGIDYEVVEMFEGVRVFRIEVDERVEDDNE
jgi:hypothetical protein